MKRAIVLKVPIILVCSFAVLAVVSQVGTGVAGYAAGVSQSIVCEELQLAVNADGSTVLHFSLADFGGPFQIVHAALLPTPTASDPDHQPILMSGTGQVIIAEYATEFRPVYYMNLHYSQEHADLSPATYWHDGRIAQIRVDLLSLEGTFWMVGANHDEARDSTPNGYDKFGVTVAGGLPDCLRKAILDAEP